MDFKSKSDEELLKQLHERNIYTTKDIVDMIIQRGSNNLDVGYIVDIFNSDYPTSRLNKSHGKFIADNEYDD